jgi:hypothetical protein
MHWSEIFLLDYMYSADELQQVAAQDGQSRSISIADAEQAGNVLTLQA